MRRLIPTSSSRNRVTPYFPMSQLFSICNVIIIVVFPHFWTHSPKKCWRHLWMTPKNITMELCLYGWGNVEDWGYRYGQLWRTSNDIRKGTFISYIYCRKYCSRDPNKKFLYYKSRICFTKLMPCPSLGPKWFWTVQIVLYRYKLFWSAAFRQKIVNKQ